MSTTFDSLPIPDGWSKAYISQLASYIRARDRDGWCCGNREQFEKRHQALLEWIENIEDYVDNNNIKFRRKK